MDQFQRELAEIARAAQTGEVRQPGEDPFKIDGSKDEEFNPLSAYSHEQIMEMYEQIKQGKIPEEIAAMQQMQADKYNDEHGNPIIDEEGGAVIQPLEGFVVKTKDTASGEKVFVNMTHHSIVEGI